MNIQTDVIVETAMLNRCCWANLCAIASKGSIDQRETLLAWAYSELPASSTAQLRQMAAMASFMGV